MLSRCVQMCCSLAVHRSVLEINDNPGQGMPVAKMRPQPPEGGLTISTVERRKDGLCRTLIL